VWWWMFVLGHEYWQERDAASPLEKRFVNLAVRADSVEHQTLASLTFLSGNYWVLTDAADNPEQIISWLNWESTPYGIVITNWGVPSSENIYDFVDGKVVFREDSLDPAKKNIEYHKRAQSWGEKTYSLCERRSAVQDGATELPFSIDPRVADTFSSQDMYVLNNTLDGYADVGWGICWGDYDLEWVWEATALNTFTLTSDDELYDTNSYITSNAEPWFVKMMTAESEEQCLKFLADARADFAAQGLKELEQFRTEAFKANLATLDQPGIVFVNK